MTALTHSNRQLTYIEYLLSDPRLRWSTYFLWLALSCQFLVVFNQFNTVAISAILIIIMSTIISLEMFILTKPQFKTIYDRNMELIEEHNSSLKSKNEDEDSLTDDESLTDDDPVNPPTATMIPKEDFDEMAKQLKEDLLRTIDEWADKQEQHSSSNCLPKVDPCPETELHEDKVENPLNQSFSLNESFMLHDSIMLDDNDVHVDGLFIHAPGELNKSVEITERVTIKDDEDTHNKIFNSANVNRLINVSSDDSDDSSEDEQRIRAAYMSMRIDPTILQHRLNNTNRQQDDSRIISPEDVEYIY